MAQAKKRILLLEDEESVSRGISFTLEKEGYAVVSCESVAQACRTFDVFDPQLMICDITLPDGSGLEIHQLMQKSVQARKNRIIGRMNGQS